MHTVLLRSDGVALACGRNTYGQCDIPTLPADGSRVTYRQVAAGWLHTVLLRSDGSVVACGDDTHGQCCIPALDGGLTYVQVAAGDGYTVLLRSDGSAVACGRNTFRQCNIPALSDQLTYTHIAAGVRHTLLLRSDGSAVACGNNDHGQCQLPALTARLTYVPNFAPQVVQLSLLSWTDDLLVAVCKDVSGDDICSIEISSQQSLRCLEQRLMDALTHYCSNHVIVTARGQLLHELVATSVGALEVAF
eukprot:TRINITY_DN36460_c0_g1_i2.p1 TRINITY_DN36460_c0_g1~~TRINITY_DN36460_c0_g1_i2.p1  ORF type:complete len:248 (-),score=26.48 TRINITY_DN36460_c0_g1_i2:185-928(-)